MEPRPARVCPGRRRPGPDHVFPAAPVDEAPGVRVVIEDATSPPGVRVLRLARRCRLVRVDVAGPDLDPPGSTTCRSRSAFLSQRSDTTRAPATGLRPRPGSPRAGQARNDRHASTARRSMPSAAGWQRGRERQPGCEGQLAGRQHVGGAGRQDPVAAVALEPERHRGRRRRPGSRSGFCRRCPLQTAVRALRTLVTAGPSLSTGISPGATGRRHPDHRATRPNPAKRLAAERGHEHHHR